MYTKQVVERAEGGLAVLEGGLKREQRRWPGEARHIRRRVAIEDHLLSPQTRWQLQQQACVWTKARGGARLSSGAAEAAELSYVHIAECVGAGAEREDPVGGHFTYSRHEAVTFQHTPASGSFISE